VSDTTQVVFAASELPQPFEAMAKSLMLPPFSATLVMLSGEVAEVLVSVTFIGALGVITTCGGNVTAPPTVTVGSARSVPLTWIVCGLLAALSAICSVAVLAPAAPANGVKVTLMVHVPPLGATEVVQPVAAKSPAFAPVKPIGWVTVKLAEPATALFVIVTVCAVLVVP